MSSKPKPVKISWRSNTVWEVSWLGLLGYWWYRIFIGPPKNLTTKRIVEHKVQMPKQPSSHQPDILKWHQRVWYTLPPSNHTHCFLINNRNQYVHIHTGSQTPIQHGLCHKSRKYKEKFSDSVLLFFLELVVSNSMFSSAPPLVLMSSGHMTSSRQNAARQPRLRLSSS